MPYVGIEVTAPGAARTIGHGDRSSEVASFPLVHAGEDLGALVVGRRPGERAIPPGEHRLLEDLSRQAAVAVANVALTENLQRSRARLLTAQEEERGRVRRDLHDGLGPQLTGIALALEGAQARTRPLDEGVADQLAGLQTGVRAAIEDVRRIARYLRPAALEQVGLGRALRDLAERARTDDLEVVVEVVDDGPVPPPDVEVALYRIAAEALANVVRHAHARRCTVQLTHGDDLRLVVDDDGRGLRADAVEGVGLPSMRHRAEAAGGSLAVEARVPRGCRVVARFPVAGP